MLEVNSETDFVARDTNFTAFAEKVAHTAVNNPNIKDVEALAREKLSGSSETVEEARLALMSKIGENVKLRRLVGLNSDGCVGSYLHGQRHRMAQPRFNKIQPAHGSRRRTIPFRHESGR